MKFVTTKTRIEGNICLENNHAFRNQLRRDNVEWRSIQHAAKRYASSADINGSSCRLCGSVKVARHCKNLFAKANRALLAAAEDIFNSLPCHELMPHLLCRSCERQLKNYVAFKTLIAQSQSSFENSERMNRCIRESPSAPRSLKSAKEVDMGQANLRCRGLSFTASVKQSTEKELQVRKCYFRAEILSVKHAPPDSTQSTSICDLMTTFVRFVFLSFRMTYHSCWKTPKRPHLDWTIEVKARYTGCDI